jgi:hypothetical protein
MSFGTRMCIVQLRQLHLLPVLLTLLLLIHTCSASYGDRLPEFKDCVKVIPLDPWLFLCH